MENAKKSAGVPLVLIILIMILIVGILLVTYLWRGTKKEVDIKENEISKLNENVNKLEKEIENLKNEDNKVKEEKVPTDDDNIESISKVEKLLKNGGEYDYLQISSIKEDDDKYLVTANYYVPITITEEEYADMVTEESISINDKEYTFEKEENENIVGYGYGYIYEEDEDVDSGYSVYKTEEGYIFLREIGGVSLTIDKEEKEISFYLESETIVEEITVGESTLAEYLSENKENYQVDKYKMTVVYDEDGTISLEADKR